MVRIMFVCLGNICRSPMAEFLMKDLVKNRGIANDFYIASAATASSEVGSPPHYGTKNKLAALGISVKGKVAAKLNKADYTHFDYFFGMDSANVRNMHRIFGADPEHKIYRLLDFTKSPRDIADPWYTGDFEQTYLDIQMGLEAFLRAKNL